MFLVLSGCKLTYFVQNLVPKPRNKPRPFQNLKPAQIPTKLRSRKPEARVPYSADAVARQGRGKAVNQRRAALPPVVPFARPWVMAGGARSCGASLDLLRSLPRVSLANLKPNPNSRKRVNGWRRCGESWDGVATGGEGRVWVSRAPTFPACAPNYQGSHLNAQRC